MRWTACLSLLLFLPAFAGDEPVRKVVRSTKDFGQRVTLPALDKGNLLFLDYPERGKLGLFAADGRRMFETVIQNVEGGSALSVRDAALDTDGTVAVSAGNFYGGALVLLDASGKQTRVTSTGRYMPARICFDQNHLIWTFGWQRDLVKNDTEDGEDYFIVRRFSKEGKELGAFVPRSTFPGRAAPFGAHFGLWQARAAGDRIGALAFPAHAGHEPEWIELDFNGNLIGHWKLGPKGGGGLAYTVDGRLYTRRLLDKSQGAQLLLFDRATSSWTPVDTEPTVAARAGLLLGADGNDLVFAEEGGRKLSWVRPGR